MSTTLLVIVHSQSTDVIMGQRNPQILKAVASFSFRNEGFFVFEGCNVEEYTVGIGLWMSDVCSGFNFYDDPSKTLEDTGDFQ